MNCEIKMPARCRRYQNKKGTQACPQKLFEFFTDIAANARNTRVTFRSKLKLGAGALAEARHGLRFGVVHIEHREQLRDLEHFLELAAQVAETQ